MNSGNTLEIFLVAAPGAEALLCAEATEKGFKDPKPGKGGVTIRGDWAEAWRANFELRGASRVLVRIDAFRALHLSQLDKRARRVAWGEFLRPDVPVRVETSCTSSRIYHSGAATQRIAKAIHEELGAPISPDAEVCIKARIDDDLCTISIDTSGSTLHKRGHKEAVNKAPMRETLASLFLRQCGFDGSEPVVDPMCGSGTFVIEAAEIAAGLLPGRSRHFAFEHLVSFDEEAWQQLRARATRMTPNVRFFGYDRDAGAIRMSRANAERAGVEALTEFRQQPISELVPPEGPPDTPLDTPPGLVIVNPPYGTRLGSVKSLYPLYQALGQTLMTRFHGWRVGLITNSDVLAKKTGLPFAHESAPVSHGGISVKVYSTSPLP
ncbi:MAG: class I SAM-dependent RNA methyltransferase [Rhodospirillales bacterium]|nr:class I SAM-dependent RNA methyltransferase [Rhodospirillales bacterium]